LTLTGRTFIDIRASRHRIYFKSALAGALAIIKKSVGTTRIALIRRAVVGFRIAVFALRGISVRVELRIARVFSSGTFVEIHTTSNGVASKAGLAATFIAVVIRILAARVVAFKPARYIAARLASARTWLRTTGLVAQVRALRVGASTAQLGAIHHETFINVGASFEPISFISGFALTLALDRDGIGAARLARKRSGLVDAPLVGTHC
jgi:hypothetical protein